jgi:hypothetical protein
MRHELSIETLIGPDDRVLVEVAQTLHSMKLLPECFLWSAIPDSGEARIWVVVTVGETKFRGLVADLSTIPGVRQIAVHGPGQAIIERLVMPRAH